MDASAFTRTFNLQRLKSQICFIYLPEGCVLAGMKLLFIVEVIWGIARRMWISVELFFEGLTRIIVVVR